jgi:gamma-glutamylcyclotransferase (GGCT)/AIG2-like uncharacterized protein YtfP
MNLFIYGTLTVPRIFERLSGTPLTPESSESIRSCPARVPGFRIESLDGTFPYAIRDSRSTIDGLLVLGIDKAALRRIDEYEGEEYIRIPIRVRSNRGVDEAEIYVARDQSQSHKD